MHNLIFFIVISLLITPTKKKNETFPIETPDLQRKSRQTFYKNKNFVILLLNSVKAPRRALYYLTTISD